MIIFNQRKLLIKFESILVFKNEFRAFLFFFVLSNIILEDKECKL